MKSTKFCKLRNIKFKHVITNKIYDILLSCEPNSNETFNRFLFGPGQSPYHIFISRKDDKKLHLIENDLKLTFKLLSRPLTPVDFVITLTNPQMNEIKETINKKLLSTKHPNCEECIYYSSRLLNNNFCEKTFLKHKLK